MKKYARVLSLHAVLALIGLTLVSCQSAPAEEPLVGADAAASTTANEVRIGVVYPLSGADGQAGADVKAAVELAAAIVNDPNPDVDLPLASAQGLPNLGGARISPVFADHQGNPESGAAETERLVTEEEVAALYGAYQSAVTMTSSEAAERLGIPFVVGESSMPELTQRGYTWLFRTTPHDMDNSRAIFDFISALNDEMDAGLETVALFAEDGAWGTNSKLTQRAEAERIGVTVATEISYDADATSLEREVAELRDAEADALLPTSYLADSILTVRTLKDLGYTPKIIIAQDAGYVNAAFGAELGEDAEGIASRAAFASDIASLKPAANQINEMYEANTGRSLTDTTARAFTGFMTLADAVNRAGSADPEDIRQALTATDIAGEDTIMPWQGIRFDATGQNVLGQAIIVQLQDGEYRTVFPEGFKTTNVIFPMVPWDERDQ